MRSSVSAVFFLAMVPLGLMAAELRTDGHQTSNVQGTAAEGGAQHRLLRRGGGSRWRRRWRRRHGDDSEDDSTDAPAPTPYTAEPTTTPPVPSPTPEPTTEPPVVTVRPVPSPTPEPTTEAPVPAPTPEPTTEAPVAAPTPSTDMETLLALHNEARCLHNANDLTYSDDVAASAMVHLQVLINDCGQLYHSEPEDRNNYGENLYQCGGTSATSCYTPEAAMAALYDSEVQVATVAAYGGHATQILWKSTTEMGCAVDTCNADGFLYAYLVCQYDPAGNLLSNLANEVDLPTGTC